MGSQRNFNFTFQMQINKDQHKWKPMRFTSVVDGIQKRLETNKQEKKRKRHKLFDIFRSLPVIPEELNNADQKRLDIAKYLEQKRKKKAESLVHKKKPFLIASASTMTFGPPPPISWPLPSTSGRVTSSSTLRARITNKKQKPIVHRIAQNEVLNPTLKNLKMPSVSTFRERKCEPQKQSRNVKSSNDALKQESKILNSPTKLNDVTQAKQNQNKIKVQKKPVKKLATTPFPSKTKPEPIFNPKPSSSSDCDTCSKETNPFQSKSSSEKLPSPKASTSNEQVEQISPRVCLSRGNDETRKEMKKNIDDKANVPLMSAENFKIQLYTRMKKMTKKCEAWHIILQQNMQTLPDEIRAALWCATRQAHLLLSQKLQLLQIMLQSRETEQAFFARTDLQEYWNTVLIEFEAVQTRFDELRRRSRASEKPAAAAHGAEPRPKPAAKRTPQ